MAFGAELVLRDDATSIAERNEDINRRRLERERSANSGGPLTITDRAAFARFCAAAERAAAEAQALAVAEEAERARREGAAYKPRAQREAEARARRRNAEQPDADEARGVRQWCDPSKDYYRTLGVERVAATHEIKKAYKRLAIQLHPDKHRGTPPEAAEAIAAQFKEVMEAYDVLSDDERRASYDRLRAHALRGGGTGGGAGATGPRTPEEAAAMLRGMREMARMRREGMRRSVKHAPLAAEVRCSLQKLHRGCTKSVAVLRRCVDATGALYEETKTLHVVVRKGTPPGSKITFPDAGSETGELLPGDVIITVLEKPHKLFKREDAKDLACVGAPLRRGDALYCCRLRALSGRELLLFGSAVAASLASGGLGGFVTHELPGEGMPDPVDPWDNPPGSLTVRLHLQAVAPERRVLRCAARQRPLLLLPGAADGVPAAAAGGVIAAALREGHLAAEMDAEERSGADAPQRAQPPPLGVCIAIGDAMCAVDAPSAAAKALMASASASLRLLRWRCVRVACGGEAGELLLDDEWAALCAASVVVVDFDAAADADVEQLGMLAACERAEARIRAVTCLLASAGVLDALWLRHWRGAWLAGVGAGGVALLGAPPPDVAGPDDAAPPRTLLPMPIRAGGGARGWTPLHTALAAWCADDAKASNATGVGVLVGTALSVEPSVWWQHDSAAELLVAPPREVLVGTAAAVAAAAAYMGDGGCGEDDEDEDEGAFEDAGFPQRATCAAARRALEAARTACTASPAEESCYAPSV